MPVNSGTSIPQRLLSQISFIKEIDKLKTVFRQTPLLDQSRMENDAEHSWHLATIAIILAEYAPEIVSIARVLQMLLIHDIVEIDAGDSFIYDDAATADQEAREQAAADRLFTLLPTDQGADFRNLWDEFEDEKSPDACFAKAMDRLQPLLHNHHTQGRMWLKYGVCKSQVMEKQKAITRGAPQLWPFALSLINEAAEKGWLADS